MVKARAHIFITGNVQGIFFRQKTKEQAEWFGVKGWVRNLLDGRVEAVFEGEEDSVKALVDFCRKGPKGALVTGFTLNWEMFKGEFENFEITY
ncbi:MAG: acylphosphatase [Candidatus Bathyarchaeia archaeon]|jgi:acylphosphatase